MSKYVKILAENLIHHNFQYKEGLNIDTIPFNPSGECEPGGLYYCEREKAYLYANFGPFIADVEIPDDARIYAEPDRYKADKIIISNIRRWDGEFTEKEKKLIVWQN